MMKRVLSQDQNVWARGMAPIGGPSRCRARHDIKAKIQYNHYAMPGEIGPLQEQLERKSWQRQPAQQQVRKSEVRSK